MLAWSNPVCFDVTSEEINKLEWGPRSTVKYFNGNDENSVVKVQAGEEFVVFLDSNPTTGYSWDFANSGFISNGRCFACFDCSLWICACVVIVVVVGRCLTLVLVCCCWIM